MVLISTTAVYTKFDGDFNEASKDLNPVNQYGKSRLFLEKFCEDTFPNCLIIRLPALFGEGLKKNFLFDINNRLPKLLTQELFKKIISVIDSDLKILFLKFIISMQKQTYTSLMKKLLFQKENF